MKYCDIIESLDANKIKDIIDKYVAEDKPSTKSNDFNIFSIINLRENNHTELIAWLLRENHVFLKKFFIT